MDADLQHDENLLPQMLELLMRSSADLVIGSRYMVGGDAGGLSASASLDQQNCDAVGAPAHTHRRGRSDERISS